MTSRVALIIIGHYRTFTKTSKSIYTHIINKYNPDIYICVYNKLTNSVNTWWVNKLESRDLLESEIAQLKSLNPKYLNIIDESSFKYPEGSDEYCCGDCPYYIIYNQLYLLKNIIDNSNILSENYDYIIKTRPDILLLKPLKLDLNNYDISVSAGLDVSYIDNFVVKNGSDVIYISKPIFYKNLESILENLEKICKSRFKNTPEHIFLYAIYKSGLTIGYLDYIFCGLRHKSCWSFVRS